ncbi:MAG TPA: S26 family signal peptidase [Streptosporangiaceae bacterium]|nr:S26 family signal peptidase [Streptosporangiaceae bacterium]
MAERALPALGGVLALGGAVALPVTAVVLVRLVRLVRRNLAVVEVTGPSMQPALSSGDRVLVRRAGMSELRSGLVVVVERPLPDGGWAGVPPSWPPARRQWLIKRVAALPGDPLPDAVPAPGRADHDGLVPPDMFVVLGDNAARSHDSRAIGCVPADRLLGVMVRPLH